VIRSARAPGIAWKLLLAEPGPSSLSEVLGSLLPETVHCVRCDVPAEMVAASLAPARVPITAVWIPEGGGPVTVTLQSLEIAAARGPGERNLQAASRLLGTHLRLKESE